MFGKCLKHEFRATKRQLVPLFIAMLGVGLLGGLFMLFWIRSLISGVETTFSALGGLFSTGGPPAVLSLTNATADNATYFATIQFYFCLTNYYTTATRAINGLITLELLKYGAIGIIGCIAGDMLGRKVFDKLDAQKLKYIIYIGMIVSGILMLF